MIIKRKIDKTTRLLIIFFFFKQKTAYEIYQCDWSSDVCSYDLNTKGELRLSFDRLPVAENPEKFDAWLKHIYQLCQREPPKDISWEQEAQTLRERLRLSYPELDSIHHHLARQDISLARQLQKDEITCKDFLFKAARIVHFLLKNGQELTLSDLGARFSVAFLLLFVAYVLFFSDLKNMLNYQTIVYGIASVIIGAVLGKLLGLIYYKIMLYHTVNKLLKREQIVN